MVNEEKVDSQVDKMSRISGQNESHSLEMGRIAYRCETIIWKLRGGLEEFELTCHWNDVARVHARAIFHGMSSRSLRRCTCRVAVARLWVYGSTYELLDPALYWKTPCSKGVDTWRFSSHSEVSNAPAALTCSRTSRTPSNFFSVGVRSAAGARKKDLVEVQRCLVLRLTRASCRRRLDLSCSCA